MTHNPSKLQEAARAAPVKALFRSPVFWVLLVIDLRWFTPVFDSISWSNLWIYALFAAASMIFLSVMTFVTDRITANMKDKAGHSSSSLRFPKSVRLPFLAGATIHYAAAFIFVPTAEGMFLWLAHGFGLLLLLTARLFPGRA